MVVDVPRLVLAAVDVQDDSSPHCPVLKRDAATSQAGRGRQSDRRTGQTDLIRGGFYLMKASPPTLIF